jgi:CRISPR-associated protein Csy3
MADNKLKTASVLAFERKLDPSDALFFFGDWEARAEASAWEALGVREKAVRGTLSNRLKTKDQNPAKLDASIACSNLQTFDVASLPSDADTLMTRFTLRILGGAGTPSACNNADYQKRLASVVNGYVNGQGFFILAARYAYNLANGRFLWRNRAGAEQVEVQVRQLKRGHAEQRWVFDALELSLRNFEVPAPREADLKSLSSAIAAGLAGTRHLLLEVTAFVRMGCGQEVFPSQELILERGRGGKSKTLYSVGGVAGIHSQKLGNALRTVDTWYPADEDLGPIAVEPYGSVATQGKAYRQPRQNADFYSLLDSWVIKDQVPATEQQHFVMATLIRGGVFGEAG